MIFFQLDKLIRFFKLVGKQNIILWSKNKSNEMSKVRG